MYVCICEVIRNDVFGQRGIRAVKLRRGTGAVGWAEPPQYLR